MFLKETTRDDTEKTKRLTGIQVSTKSDKSIATIATDIPPN